MSVCGTIAAILRDHSVRSKVTDRGVWEKNSGKLGVQLQVLFGEKVEIDFGKFLICTLSLD